MNSLKGMDIFFNFRKSDAADTRDLIQMQAIDCQGDSSLPEVLNENGNVPETNFVANEHCEQTRQTPGNHNPIASMPGDNTEPSSVDHNHVTSRMPYIDSNGVLIIPFDSDPKYHYWRPGGQTLLATLQELNASQEVIEKYKSIYSD